MRRTYTSRKVQEGDIKIGKNGYVKYSPEGKWVPIYKGTPYAPKPVDNKTDRAKEWGLGVTYKKKKRKILK